MEDLIMSIKKDVELACRRAYTRGIQTGSGGNVSARIPGTDHMVVKPSKVSLIECDPETLIITDFDGNLVEGSLPPTREAVLHGWLYKKFDRIGAVVHTHSPWAISWSFTRKDLPNITMHTQLKLGCPIPVRFFSSPKGVLKEEMPEVYALFEKEPSLAAFILGAHGVVAVGENIIEAEHTAELIEETAQVAYLHQMGSKLGMFPEDK